MGGGFDQISAKSKLKWQRKSSTPSKNPVIHSRQLILNLTMCQGYSSIFYNLGLLGSQGTIADGENYVYDVEKDIRHANSFLIATAASYLNKSISYTT